MSNGQADSWGGAAYDVAIFMPHMAGIVDGEGGARAGGAERQMWLLATGLAERGRRVAVVVMQPPSGGIDARVAGVSILGPGPGRSLPGALGKAGRVLALLRVLARVDAPVLVQRSAGAATGLAGLVAWATRRRFVYSTSSVIEFDLAVVERALIVRLFHLGVRLAQTVVVQTPEQAELCRERFGRDPVLIKSLAEPQAARQGEPEAFLWIGRLARYKTFEAFVELARAVPEARFWMVPVATGASELGSLDALRSASEELPNLELHSARPREELGELIARAVAMVSTTRSEGMPNVFLEGWARGVPALTLSHDPDGVIAREGVGAFAGGSVQRFAELAREMWAARNNQADLALNCRDYVAREHSIEAIVDSWEQVLGLGAKAE